ncbi:hypothetical protein [Methanobacterium petrolearium]|uniref:hypothetical protein n=1 Tax=Methanobacterium petrolearium TaxID=710190 RepID=UPI001AE80A97|nr:hypothetical protein [Methanobacterium petrolearium]MBP1945143.1 putative spore protein YtfJ [Methanobacterium petrolearium]BDZ71071.1 hypothetical protein GCM10025861_15880 [Methanobacterium petrolearium]
MIDEEIKVGKPKKIDGRIFYPILKIFHWKHQQSEFYSVSPVALVVVEGDLKYMFHLDEVENPEEFMNMI